VREFRGFVPVKYETDDFIVTTAKSGQELFKVLELRHEVFVEEWQGRKAFHGLDVDRFDFSADHLMIVDKRINEVVGTYRLMSSHFTHDFYSASEFDIQDFVRLPVTKLEMGRACVHANYRNGSTIDLLWKGLSRYIFMTKTEFLFGCASIKSTDAEVIGRVYKTLRDQGTWSDEHRVRAEWDYQFPGFSMNVPEGLTPPEKREFLPALLRSYLHAGAKVYGWPALDLDFACTDLLTILDWKQLNPRFQSRFSKD
ncbi:MAG: GNAT family N-acetyltransferase, partial [Bdellovibrionales bacterium]